LSNTALFGVSTYLNNMKVHHKHHPKQNGNDVTTNQDNLDYP